MTISFVYSEHASTAGFNPVAVSSLISSRWLIPLGPLSKKDAKVVPSKVVVRNVIQAMEYQYLACWGKKDRDNLNTTSQDRTL